MSAPLASPLKIKNVQGDEKHRLESIADNMILDNAKYQWNDVGFTQCSESCLGNFKHFILVNFCLKRLINFSKSNRKNN